MYNPFKFLKQQIAPHYLGVDIGTTSIKIVEVDQGKQLPRLLNYTTLESQGSLTRANVALQTSSLKLFEQETVELLKAALKKMNPKTNVAVGSLPLFSAFMTVLTFPDMSQGELQKSLALQAKQYIPLPISEVGIEPLRVGEYQDDKGFKYQLVLLISVPLEQIRKHQSIFKKCGLELKALEIEALSLVRGLIGSDPTPTIIVDIGSRSAAIAFAEKGELRFTSQSDFAGASLTQAVAAALSINPLRAEELKRERGIAGTGPNYELSTIMLPYMDAIISEIKRAEATYAGQFPVAVKPERVIVSGGGANLLGIEKYMSQQLGLPVVKAAPFMRFEYPPTIEPIVQEMNPLLAVALGLTLREFR